jgi:hypothetical protein
LLFDFVTLWCCLQSLTLALSCLPFDFVLFDFATLCCCLQGLTLALSCLSFDFVGTCLDDSAEDMSTIQVRTATSMNNPHVTRQLIASGMQVGSIFWGRTQFGPNLNHCRQTNVRNKANS